MKHAEWLTALGLALACTATLALWQDPQLAMQGLALLSLCR